MIQRMERIVKGLESNELICIFFSSSMSGEKVEGEVTILFEHLLFESFCDYSNQNIDSLSLEECSIF